MYRGLGTYLNFAKKNDKVVIHDIELYLHCDIQEKMLEFIFELNPNIKLVCSTQSPSIIINGWFDKVIEISEIKPTELDSHKKSMQVLFDRIYY